jgi:hypothetical protein
LFCLKSVSLASELYFHQLPRGTAGEGVTNINDVFLFSKSKNHLTNYLLSQAWARTPAEPISKSSFESRESLQCFGKSGLGIRTVHFIHPSFQYFKATFENRNDPGLKSSFNCFVSVSFTGKLDSIRPCFNPPWTILVKCTPKRKIRIGHRIN